MVEQAGSVAGFAAIIGLAVLSALYFSQARDLRRLREWAGRAPERAAEGQPGAVVPGRVVAVPQQPRPAQPPAPATPAGAAPPAAPGNGADGKDEEGEKAAQPAASNGDAAPAVTAAEGAKGGEGEDGEGEESKDGAAAAKPGMPAPASAAAAAAGAKSVVGPAAPGSAPAGAPGSAPGGQSGSAPSGQPGSAPGGQSGSAPAAPSAKPAGAGAAGGAAAGAAAARGSGAPPGAPARPGAAPQRTPGSVLPPRTGTLPPVRRLPSSNVGPAQPGGPGQAPEKRKRNPVYVVLAVAGVLILGAGAAVGVPALVNGSKDDTPSSNSASKSKAAKTKKAATPAAPNSITVAVLNGTAIPGLAAQVADRVDAEGFAVGTISNASQTAGQRANSVAMYATGHKADAEQVAKQLNIRNVTRVDSNSQQIAGDASVVVIVGADKTQ